MELVLHDEELALCRLDPDSPVPDWASSGFVCTVSTPEELSIVCPAACVPDDVETNPGWRALRVAGTLDLAATGILVKLLAPLDQAEVPIFVVSTFDTDYVLVPGERLEAATTALSEAGHPVGRALT